MRDTMTNENEQVANVETLDKEAEVQRLRDHAASLLDERKQSKAKEREAAAELQKAQASVEDLEIQLRAVRLLAPVDHLLSELVKSPEMAPGLLTLIKARGYDFELDDSGSPIVVDAEGNRPTITIKESRGKSITRPAEFTASDVARLLAPEDVTGDDVHPLTPMFAELIVANRASGGGAGGVRRGSMPTKPEAHVGKAQPAKVQPFGLA